MTECTTVKIFKSDLQKLKGIRRILEGNQEKDLQLQDALHEVIETYREVKGLAKQQPNSANTQELGIPQP